MGLFSKRTGPVDIGHFSSPHDVDAMLSVVYTGVQQQLTSPAPEVSAPSPMGSIYLSRYGRDGLTVTAGNTIETFFAFLVDLTSTLNGVNGHAYFDRPSASIQRWMGNAINLHFGLKLALVNASIQTTRWNDRY